MSKEASKKTFYFRCQACDMKLDEFQQKKGLCTDCRKSVFLQNHVWSTKTVEHEVYRMWNPPMGSVDEFFEDVENDYEGS